jgi:hypothetical protein
MSRDSELAPLCDALADVLHERATPPRPDFADVLSRAEAMSDQPLPSSLRDGLAEANIDDDEEDDDVDDRPDAELSLFAADLRDRHERHLRDRELRPIPAARPAQVRTRWVPYAVVASLAAALLLVIFGRGDGWLSTAAQDDGAGAPSEAERTYDARRAEERAARLEAERRERAAMAEVEPVEPDAEVELMPEPPAIEPAPSEPKAVEKTPRVTVEDLESQARAAWRRGELAEAERLFRRVTQRVRRGDAAELAFGDLFSIVKQRSGAAGQAKVWREYLQRFPDGRFSDDARAGLCRRATGEAQRTCWVEYLREHPNGTHADRARRVTAEGEG